MNAQKIWVRKKDMVANESRHWQQLIQQECQVPIPQVALYEQYTITGLSPEAMEQALSLIFAEQPVDNIYRTVPVGADDHVIGREFLPGQYDQRADSAMQCIAVLTHQSDVTVHCAQFLVITGALTSDHMDTVRRLFINPVDSREAFLTDAMPTLDLTAPGPTPVLSGFTMASPHDLARIQEDWGLAMTLADLTLIQDYFKEEQRDPTETEIRVLDTYWSDHCRHTTFATYLDDITIEASPRTEELSRTLSAYLKARQDVAAKRGKAATPAPTLMEMATMAVKELRLNGALEALDVSDEINACTIHVPVTIDGVEEDWLLLFKNETHNHPTEIEPFGGAATCLGGCIRDPLSGRAYVYQAMRVTGAGDPRTPLTDTLPGKLPQRFITTEAAHGYSSYGNQIGLATGEVKEYYHPGFVAKRMEVGAVIAAAPADHVRRERPLPGDAIILVGGQTGRDGCGGATGSSKEHTTESLATCGTEVQKGNPITERKIQRLFRRGEVTRLIKKCNDFGAGGVSVAIGELADGLCIDLNAVPKKYEGLTGTELAISESQERMACVIADEDTATFLAFCAEENVEATIVARVQEDPRLVMEWNGQRIVDIARSFLDTNGAAQHRTVHITAPAPEAPTFADDAFDTPAKDTCHSPSNATRDTAVDDTFKAQWIARLQDLNSTSQQGLGERFDSTIGANTVLLPFGGAFQKTPVQGMVSLLPVRHGTTTTASIMTHGYDPFLSAWSPFHGAQFAILESVAKVVTLGGDYTNTYLSLQEYFPKLGTDPTLWGAPTAALLGAYRAQTALGIGAIGGKDSMSGTFHELTVPPTLISFAVTTAEVTNIISPAWKEYDHPLYLLPQPTLPDGSPDWEAAKAHWSWLTEANKAGYIDAAYVVTHGGLPETFTKQALGNRIGAHLTLTKEEVLQSHRGAIVVELSTAGAITFTDGIPGGICIGQTTAEETITVADTVFALRDLETAYESTLAPIFPLQAPEESPETLTKYYDALTEKVPLLDPTTWAPAMRTARPDRFAMPRVLLPVFPGTNCEYDTARAFEAAGADTDIVVIQNRDIASLEASIDTLVRKLEQTQILMFPGGFSAGDEPDGSGKYIATFFRNPRLMDAVHQLLYKQDGLILGICNGFQALIKLGLLPTGYITPLTETNPTLTYNTIGRHLSRMVHTVVTSTASPWMSAMTVGDVYTVPISHGEGRFLAPPATIDHLFQAQQVATQYADTLGNPSPSPVFNPNQSMAAIEGLLSPDGRILGKMAHSERCGSHIASNIPGEKSMPLFASGVSYFK